MVRDAPESCEYADVKERSRNCHGTMEGMEKRENIEWLDMIMVIGMRERKKDDGSVHVHACTTQHNQWKPIKQTQHQEKK